MPRNAHFYDRLADATGEDRHTLMARGFQPGELPLGSLDEPDDRPPLMIDWDAHQARSERLAWPRRLAA